MFELDINNFKKKHDFLICIDSDGTAIDAMNAKHMNCHGPALINTWELQNHKEYIQDLWNQINLYNETRGVNRFVALVQMLEEINNSYITETDIATLKKWVESSSDLSNKGLELEVKNNPADILQKALKWSYEINDRIAKLSTDDKPAFQGVREFLTYAKDYADIAVISSSNMDAIYEEWTNHNLIKFLDVMTSQEVGTKGACLQKMIEKGYHPTQVLMVGDAYPDLVAAQANKTFFYPILTRKEELSWRELQDKYFHQFINHEFSNEQEKILNKFKNNFE